MANLDLYPGGDYPIRKKTNWETITVSLFVASIVIYTILSLAGFVEDDRCLPYRVGDDYNDSDC